MCSARPGDNDPVNDSNDDDANQMCGVGRFRPRALQMFARPQLFTLLYSAVGILQNAHFYYFFAIMSTLQRRYGLSSWSITVVLFADSASPFFVSFLVGHYSRSVSKPLLIFFAILALVISCGMSALPFFLYGPGLALSVEDSELSRDALESCQPDSGRVLDSGCDGRGLPESVVVTAVLFAANCFYGSAYSVLFIAGSTYVDDSVKKKNSPLHFATFAILKLAGPTLGYALGSLCLRYYEDPRLAPVLERTDPRWVGAWWLGYVVLGACLAVTALPILLFPRYLSTPPAAQRSGTNSTAIAPAKKTDEPAAKSGFWRSVRSLFRNPAYVFRLVYWLLVSNANLGHAMMSSKYVEVQFRTSASQASFLIGPVLMITNALGLGMGGLALHSFKPRPRLVTLYTTLCDVLRLACLIACAFIGCEAIRLAGTVTTVSGHGSSIQLPCSDGCNCTTRHFQPICDPANRTVFFSPCHAGCTKMSATDSGEVSFDECSCLPKPLVQLQQGQQQMQPLQAGQGAPYLGLCSGDTCSNVLTFIALSSLVGFIARTTTVGHTIVGLRCVSREEKAMALGVQEGLSSVFTYIPYPILYGAIFDSACLVWEDKCGRPGVCWLYDADRLRYTYHGLSVAIILFAVLFEVGLVYHSGRLTDFYTDTAPKASQKDKLIATETVVCDSEAVCLVDSRANNRPVKSGKMEKGEGEDEGLLNGVQRHATSGCCARDSQEQTSVC